MSEIRDPEHDQPLPVPTDGPSMHDLVAADLADRKALGLRKYGSLLQAYNGRSAIRDLYEELLDATVYARQILEEGSPVGAGRASVAKLALQSVPCVCNEGETCWHHELATRLRHVWACTCEDCDRWARARELIHTRWEQLHERREEPREGA